MLEDLGGDSIINQIVLYFFVLCICFIHFVKDVLGFLDSEVLVAEEDELCNRGDYVNHLIVVQR